MKLFVITTDRFTTTLQLDNSDYRTVNSVEDLFSFIQQHKYIVLILGDLAVPQGAIICVSEDEQNFIANRLTEWVGFFCNNITIRKII